MVINTINTRKYIKLFMSCKVKDSRPSMIILLTFIIHQYPTTMALVMRDSIVTRKLNIFQIMCGCVVNWKWLACEFKFSRKFECYKLDCIMIIWSQDSSEGYNISYIIFIHYFFVPLIWFIQIFRNNII